MTTSHHLPVELADAESATTHFIRAGLDITAAVPDYVRHKSGQTTVIAYRFVTGQGRPARGYAHWSADVDRAEAVQRKAASLRPRPSPIGPGLTRLDRHTTVYGFPNDARLRRLRWYGEPRKIKRSLQPLAGPGRRISGRGTTVDVLRYKPERRLVAKVDLAVVDRPSESLLVRYSTTRQAAALAEVARSLLANGVSTPMPLAQLDSGRVGVDRFVDGTEFRDLIRSGVAVPAALADGLRRFHATPIPAISSCQGRGQELTRVRAALAGLVDLHPDLATAICVVAGLLVRLDPPPAGQSVLIHGDLHPKNLLGDPTAVDPSPTFVDLERVAVGNPAADLGRLLGHALALGIRRPGWSPGAVDFAADTIELYRRKAPVEERVLAWYTAISLIDQAVLVARHLEPGWWSNSGRLVALAHDQLFRTQRRGAGS